MKSGLAVIAAAIALLASSAAAPGAGGVPHWNYWLCYPGTANDWCSVDLTTDVFYANGKHVTEPVSVASNPKFDCFYVYPTVSEEHRANATLQIEPAERETAITQGARFSHVCRVYAPLYRQVTAYGHTIYKGNRALAYNDVLKAWRDYLAHYNHGRGVVLIGHSQGAGVLTQLIQKEIDNSPSERKLLVSAILLGGEVYVPRGKTVGGSFHHVPACTSSTETGCVVAYEAWNKTPPKSWDSGYYPKTVTLCTNPAALGGGSAPITPIFAGINPQGIAPIFSKYVDYHWVEFPGLYTAKCVVSGSRSWLLVTRTHHRGDTRPTVTEALGPDDGLHAADVNITQANLVSLVASEGQAWLAHH